MRHRLALTTPFLALLALLAGASACEEARSSRADRRLDSAESRFDSLEARIERLERADSARNAAGGVARP